MDKDVPVRKVFEDTLEGNRNIGREWNEMAADRADWWNMLTSICKFPDLRGCKSHLSK